MKNYTFFHFFNGIPAESICTMILSNCKNIKKTALRPPSIH